MARFHTITDIETGETTRVPFTAQEEAARDAEEAQAAIDQAAQDAATTERNEATTDLRDQYQTAIARLDAIIDDPTTTDTAAKVRTEFRALAVIVKRHLRYTRAQAG